MSKSFKVAGGMGYAERYASVLACFCIYCSLFVPGLAAASSMDASKIVLNQGNNRQFVEYDVDTPSLKMFTSCVWLRIYDISNEVPLFAYRAVTDGRVERLITVWLEAGGARLRAELPGGRRARAPIGWRERAWHRLCLSWDSDDGAFATFLDGVFISCHSDEQLLEYAMPGNGRISIGNGLDSEGFPLGFNGEVYGFNMIRQSIFEISEYHSSSQMLTESNDYRFFAAKPETDYTFVEKMNSFEDDAFMNDDIIEQSVNNEVLSYDPGSEGGSFIRINTPASEVRHTVGKYFSPNSVLTKSPGKYTQFLDKKTYKPDYVDKRKAEADASKVSEGIRNVEIIQDECCLPSMEEHVQISEIEIPPHLNALLTYDTMPVDMPPLPSGDGVGCKTRDIFGRCTKDIVHETKPTDKTESLLSEVETPPLKQNSSKVYGQWIFRDTYRKPLNIPSRKKQIPFLPPTIPSLKYSDESPYASNIASVRLLPLLSTSNQYVTPKKANIIKRDATHDFLVSESSDNQDYTMITDVVITHRGSEYAGDDAKEQYKRIDSEHFASSIVPQRRFNYNVLPKLPRIVEVNSAANHRNTNEKSSQRHNLEDNLNGSCPRGNLESANPSATRYMKGNYWTKDPSHADFENLLDQLIEKYSTTQTKQTYEDRPKEMTNNYRYSFANVLNNRRQNATSRHNRVFMKWIKLGNALGENLVVGPPIKKISSFPGDSENAATVRHRTDIDGIGRGSSYFPSPSRNVCPKLRKKFGNKFDAYNAGLALVNMSLDKCSTKNGPSLLDESGLLINWTDTPIRLFGGATIVKGTIMCD